MTYRLLLLCALLLITSQASAHEDSLSFESQTGRRLIDIGYDVPLHVGVRTTFDFDITESEGPSRGKRAPYTAATVTLESGALTQWKKSFDRPEIGRVVKSVTPTSHGHWMLRIRYSRDAALLAEAEFPVEILGDEPKRQPLLPVIIISAIVILGAGAAYGARQHFRTVA